MEPAAATHPPRPAHGKTPAAPAEGASLPPKFKRRFRNYLLDTGMQLRLASYLLAFAVALSLGLGWRLWTAYRETSEVVALAAPEVASALASEDKARIVTVSVILALVLVCLLGASVVITHRIAGPAFAIRRTCGNVAEGKLARPPPLRSHDLLKDLADAVAAMVDVLRDREVQDREAMVRAARTLRDPGATPEASAAAAAELERIAAEKEARLQA
jgi:HAMP domain-containing protein